MSVPSIRYGRAQARALGESLDACARDASNILGHHRDQALAPAPPSIPQNRRQR